MTPDYYEAVASAFDEAAGSYDRLYGTNRIMAWMRGESLALLMSAFRPGSRLLEVGCGTGEEALALAAAGYRIVATDVSPAMIQTAQAKPQPPGAPPVSWRALPAGRLAELADEGGDRFDGAYSSFGALNCEPDLRPVARALARLLPPGAPLVCSVMNRWCLWEIGWSLVHLRPREAFRRARPGWRPAGLASPQGSLAVPVRYYSPGALARALAPCFAAKWTMGLPVALPPPYLSPLLERRGRLFARLEALDGRLRVRAPFRGLGDHFAMVLVRTEAAP